MDQKTINRFMDKVYMEPNSGCWLWTADFLDYQGYGKFWLNGRNERAHRAAWILFNKELPKESFVCHKCDTPSCVNPSHLWLGDIKSNNADRASKGRSFQSLKTHCPKGHEFTEENTYRKRPQWRECKICIRERHKKEWIKKQNARLNSPS